MARVGQTDRSRRRRSFMRLVGFAFTHPDGPVLWGYLPLEDLAILLGRNDVGKSRMVRWMAEWLEQAAPVHNEGGIASGVFFAQLDTGERDELLRHLADRYSRSDVPDLDSSPPVLRDAAAPATALLELASHRLQRESGHPCDALVRALGESALFAFEPAPAEPSWRVRWCISRAAADDDYLRAELERLRRVRGVAGRDMADILLGVLDEPPALAVPEAPPAIAALGEVSVAVLPSPRTVPREWSHVYEAAEFAIGALLRGLERFDEQAEQLHAVFRAAEAHDREETLTAFERLRLRTSDRDLPRPAQEQWVEWPATDTIRLRPDAAAAASALRIASEAALPWFLARDYLLDVSTALRSHLTGDGALRLGLWDRRAGTYAPIEDAADGWKVWLQLAYLEGIDGVSALAIELRGRTHALVELHRHLAEVRDALVDAESTTLLEAPDERNNWTDEQLEARDDHEGWLEELEETFEAIAQETNAYRDAVERFRSNASLPAPSQRGLSAALRAFRPGVDPGAALRTPLYLLDEPERHLHPALVPPAARWLMDTVRMRRSQAVVITHGVPFLNLHGARYS
jgi:hypothetical protein